MLPQADSLRLNANKRFRNSLVLDDTHQATFFTVYLSALSSPLQSVQPPVTHTALRHVPMQFSQATRSARCCLPPAMSHLIYCRYGLAR